MGLPSVRCPVTSRRLEDSTIFDKSEIIQKFNKYDKMKKAECHNPILLFVESDFRLCMRGTLEVLSEYKFRILSVEN